MLPIVIPLSDMNTQYTKYKQHRHLIGSCLQICSKIKSVLKLFENLAPKIMSFIRKLMFDC